MRFGLFARIAALGFVLFAASGCATYYRVADPHSEKVYYTKSIKRGGSGGYVEFKAEPTGETVTLQTSEVAQISQYEFDKETK